MTLIKQIDFTAYTTKFQTLIPDLLKNRINLFHQMKKKV